MKQRRIVVAFEGVQVLDVCGPLEVFSVANRMVGTDAYATTLVTSTGGPLRSSSGLSMVADSAVADVRGAIDTVVVAGGTGTPSAMHDDALLRWLSKVARRVRRMTSVCSGAFVLARAGLLDGKRATTHWSECEQLARAFPAVTVDPDPIFVKDGSVYTSAGVTAGMDLALALVEEDHGRDVALEVARWLVLFLKRPGGQSQFSAHLTSQLAERDVLRDVQAWVADHLDADLSVSALAERAGMSTRNFARAFRREVGITPAEFVERARVEAARHLLETTTEGVAAVARRCGFGTPETLHRTFGRKLHVSPGEYRRRFRVAG